MRYEGMMKVTGYVRIVVDQTGISLPDARARAQGHPSSYKAGCVQDLEFEEWDEPLQRTQDDEEE